MALKIVSWVIKRIRFAEIAILGVAAAALFAFQTGSQALADESSPVILHRSQTEAPMQGLRFGTARVLIAPQATVAKPVFRVIIPGVYIAQKRTLAVRTGEQFKTVPMRQNNVFYHQYFTARPDSTVTFYSVDPYGKYTQETVQIQISALEWKALTEKIADLANRYRSDWQVGLGYTLANVKDNRIPGFSQGGLTAKAGLTRTVFPPNWSLNINSFVTVIAFPSGLEGFSARFFGANARMGYTLPFVRSPMRARVWLGWYYTTMMVSSEFPHFGFKHMPGPQLFTDFAYSINPLMKLALYGKFSPALASQPALSMSNREVAAGASFAYSLGEDRAVSLNLDFSDYTLLLQGVAIHTQTQSIGLGLSF